jgi:flagellar export protein FliJ
MQISESRLHTVIKVKTHQQKNAQRELVQIQETKQKETGVLSDLRDTHEWALSDSVRAAKIRATDAQTSRAFIQRLGRQIERQAQEVEKISHQEDTKRGELLEKSQSKRMVERLEEKRKVEAAKEADRRDQKLIDVLAQRLRLGF